MKKVLRHSVVVSLMLMILAGNLFLGVQIYSQEMKPSDREQAYDHIALLTKVIDQIRKNYVDEEKTEFKELIYGALRGMLQSLDPHSQFMDPDMYLDMRDDTSGHFGGLGIVISIRDNVLTIVSPMEDTPGFRAGLLSGDRIIEISGSSTEEFGKALWCVSLPIRVLWPRILGWVPIVLGWVIPYVWCNSELGRFFCPTCLIFLKEK